jgi:hypothetical protein
MKSQYDRKRRALTVVFKHKEIAGFDSKGYPIYRFVERTQIFYGMNKQECILEAKKYIKADPLQIVRYGRYVTLNVR